MPRKREAKPGARANKAALASARGEQGLSEVEAALVGTATVTTEGSRGGEPQPVQQATSTATAWTELDLICPTCNVVRHAPTCIFLNAEDSPQLVEHLVRGDFNLSRCPLCHRIDPIDYPFTFYDPARRLAVQVRSGWEWHAGGGEEWYAARLEDFFEQWAEHDVRIDVVFGQEQLVERFLQDRPAPSPPLRRGNRVAAPPLPTSGEGAGD